MNEHEGLRDEDHVRHAQSNTMRGTEPSMQMHCIMHCIMPGDV